MWGMGRRLGPGVPAGEGTLKEAPSEEEFKGWGFLQDKSPVRRQGPDQARGFCRIKSLVEVGG